MTTPCGILGCPNLAHPDAEITVSYEDDFGVATEKQIQTCLGHAYVILQETRRVSGGVSSG